MREIPSDRLLTRSFSAGRKSQLLTNHFRCELPRRFQCHQYDIEVEVPNRDGTWRPAKKDDRFRVLTMISEREHFPLVWYDEGKSLYSLDLLVDLKDQYDITIAEKKTAREQKYRLRIIKWVKSYDSQVLWDFIENRLSIRPRDPIRVLETLLKQTTRASMVCVKNQFYDRRQTLDDLGSSNRSRSSSHFVCSFRGWTRSSQWFVSSDVPDQDRSNDQCQLDVHLFLSTDESG